MSDDVQIKDMPVGFHGKFCIRLNGVLHTWFIQSLVKACEGLPVVEIKLEELDVHLDTNGWFHGDNEPTLRSIIKHTQRALLTNLEHPIIISDKHGVMDGDHRIMKAHITGCTAIRAIRISDAPTADFVGEW